MLKYLKVKIGKKINTKGYKSKSDKNFLCSWRRVHKRLQNIYAGYKYSMENGVIWFEKMS